MNKILYITVILSFLILGKLSAQVHIKTPNYSDWYVDVLGEILISTQNNLFKYNAKGQQLATWSSSTNSPITSFDARNALRIIVFHRDTYQIYVLDRNLIEIGSPVNLSLSGFNDITAVCGSSMNGFWLVDALTQELYHMQPNQTINQTTSLQNHLNVSEIIKITEYDRNVWILTESNTWIVFDMFGSYLTRYVEDGLSSAQITRSPLTFAKSNQICQFNTLTGSINCISLFI